MKNNNLKINTLGKMSIVKQSIITAVCIALCVVFPMAFHSIPQAGIIYCPMHIPVLICGLICAPQYAAVCGISGVLLSSVLTGMPPVAMLPSMLVELTCYALISSLLMKFVHTKKSALDLYISLAGALVTAVLQSSSATTVMVIGFVSAGLMSLPQAISIIFGANIGTTMTAQIIAFKISDYIYIIILLDLLFRLLRNLKK